MLNAELLKQTWEESFLGRRPYDVLTLVGWELPDVDDDEEWHNATKLSEIEVVTNAISMYLTDKFQGIDPLSILTTGIALDYLAANREVLEGLETA
jgi:hypothetical protein